MKTDQYFSLKTKWFEETGEDFQVSCKLMVDKKHSIEEMWKIFTGIRKHRNNEIDTMRNR